MRKERRGERIVILLIFGVAFQLIAVTTISSSFTHITREEVKEEEA